MDCVLMKFLMLCIRAWVNFPSIGMLDFFLRLLSPASCLVGDRLRVEFDSRLITLSEEGATTSSGLASDARKPLAFRDITGRGSEIDPISPSLDVGGFGMFTIIVLMFLTENRGGPVDDGPLETTEITDGLPIGMRMATGVATSMGEYSSSSWSSPEDVDTSSISSCVSWGSITVEKRSYRKSQRRFSDAPSIVGFDALDLGLRLSSSVGFSRCLCSSSSLAAQFLLISSVWTVILTSGEKELSGVRTLVSEGVSAAESFSGEFDLDGSESVL